MDNLRPQFKIPLIVSFLLFVLALTIKNHHLLDFLGGIIDIVGTIAFCAMFISLFAYINLGYHVHNN